MSLNRTTCIFVVSCLLLLPVIAFNVSSSPPPPVIVEAITTTDSTEIIHETTIASISKSDSLTESTTTISTVTTTPSTNSVISSQNNDKTTSNGSSMSSTLTADSSTRRTTPSNHESEEDEEEDDTHLSRRLDISQDVIPESLKNKCIMKDTCAVKENILGDVKVPCFERHDPHRIADHDALQTLKQVCPSLFRSESGEEIEDPLVCCSADQIYELENNFQFPAQLGLSRCPSCSYNFRASLCEMTCNPRQADFLRVVNTSLSEDNIRQQIDVVEYHLDASFPSKLYESCKGVQGLAAGQKLLDLMCGQWGSRECTGIRWLEFIGESVEDNGQSPLGIKYVFHEIQNKSKGVKVRDQDSSDPLIPLSPSSFECWQKPSPGDLSCSCNDCEETCRRKQLPAEAKFLPTDIDAMQVMGMTGAIFSSLLMFLFLVSLILTYFLMNAYQKKRTQNRKFLILSETNEVTSLLC